MVRKIILLICISFITASFPSLKINPSQSKSLVFVGDTYTAGDLQAVQNDYKELSNLNVVKGDFDEGVNGDCFAVSLDEVKRNTDLAKFIETVIETKLVYFIGDGTVQDVEKALGQKIEISAMIFDKETDLPKSEKAKYSNDNACSVFRYSNDTSLTGYGERAIVSQSSKEALLVTTMREFKNDTTPHFGVYDIEKSGNGSKLYTDYKRDIWTYSTWTLYDLPSTDTSSRYYAMKVTIYFNHDGKQACVKQYGNTSSDMISIGAKPTNTKASGEWKTSTSSGIPISYSGKKAKVTLSRPNSYTNQWCFSDGTFFGTAYFNSENAFECVTEWSVSYPDTETLFCYDEHGYDRYGGYTTPTTTAIYL